MATRRANALMQSANALMSIDFNQCLMWDSLCRPGRTGGGVHRRHEPRLDAKLIVDDLHPIRALTNTTAAQLHAAELNRIEADTCTAVAQKSMPASKSE